MKKIVIIISALSGFLFAQTAQELINQNGCFACHSVASKKTAPAFAGIGMRNKHFNGSNAKVVIMNSIKYGSKGKYPMFANKTMPAFKNLSQKNLSILADYILEQSSKAQCNGKRGQGMSKKVIRQ